MRIATGVDQLGIDAHAICRALDATFQDVRDTERTRDFAQVTCRSIPVLHHACSADHFEVGDLGQAGEDFVLHTLGKIGVRFFLAQIIEGQDGDALFR